MLIFAISTSLAKNNVITNWRWYVLSLLVKAKRSYTAVLTSCTGPLESPPIASNLEDFIDDSLEPALELEVTNDTASSPSHESIQHGSTRPTSVSNHSDEPPRKKRKVIGVPLSSGKPVERIEAVPMPHMLYPKSCYEGYEINDICEPEGIVLQRILVSSLDCDETKALI